MNSSRPRLQEVAVRAGVSVATVSKVVNGRKDVSAPTRARVLAMLDEIGYLSPSARGNDAGSKVVLALFDGIHTMYSATVLDGMVMAAGATGAELVVRYIDSPRGGKSNEPARLPAGCIGIVAVTMAMRGMRAYDPRGTVPVIVIDPSDPAKKGWTTIGGTNWAGARSATEHLVELGHKRIAWAGGLATSEASIERLHGYRAALHVAGLNSQPAWELHDDYSVDAGLRMGAQLLQGRNPPSAIVAANDEIAIGIILAARDMGIEVPRDLSVTGFDDTPQASWFSPQLTTVRQPLADMGRLAVRIAVENSEGQGPESDHIQLTTRLIPRSSTGPIKSR